MSPDKRRKQNRDVAHDESVGKVFCVVGENARRCLICEQLFTRRESFEHSTITCYHIRARRQPGWPDTSQIAESGPLE
jgi:hypothetical protein